MQEIKPDQIWEEGMHHARVINAFGVWIVIRCEGESSDEEITEDEFRKRFEFDGPLTGEDFVARRLAHAHGIAF